MIRARLIRKTRVVVRQSGAFACGIPVRRETGTIGRGTGTVARVAAEILPRRG